MSDTFYDLSTPALTKVIDDNLIEKSLSFARAFGGEEHGPNPWWYITGEAMPGNNGIVRASFDGDVEESIEAALAPFHARSLPITWWVGPTSTPRRLGRHVQQYGFTHNRDMIGMATDLDKLSVPDCAAQVRFERVEDRETLNRWYGVILDCFPTSYSQVYLDALAATGLRADDAWQHYIARMDDTVVSASSLYLGAGVAGLYNLGTVSEMRGQGIGAWITAQTFLAARARGYRVGTLQTTYPNALRMYHRMGFEVYGKIGIYRYTPGA